MSAFPKPTPVERPAKPLKRRKRIQAKRWGVSRGPSRRVKRETPDDKAYKAWIHTQPCVYDGQGSHDCAWTRDWNPIEQSHERNMTGMGRKEPNHRSIAMCRELHRQWEQHKVNFAGWSKEKRREWFAARVAEANAAFAATTRRTSP